MFYENLTVVSRKIVVGFGYVYEGRKYARTFSRF